MYNANRGLQVYCANLRPETEIEGSLDKKYFPSEARDIFLCKVLTIEVEGV